MPAMGLGLEITELRLGLPGDGGNQEKKRSYSEIDSTDDKKTKKSQLQPAVAVVGWPPVCSYRRRNSLGSEKDCQTIICKEEMMMSSAAAAATTTTAVHAAAHLKGLSLVKISMDGVPFLRKVDLTAHNGYSELVEAFEKLFGSYGNIGEALKKDSESSDYVPTYEDEDGDWMLLGDVPWKMFAESCKRLRIMKRSEAKGYTGLVQSKKKRHQDAPTH